MYVCVLRRRWRYLNVHLGHEPVRSPLTPDLEFFGFFFLMRYIFGCGLELEIENTQLKRHGLIQLKLRSINFVHSDIKFMKAIYEANKWASTLLPKLKYY
jgi:hypothetical protein